MNSAARVLVTKLAAAQRQLDAAIRMYFAGEDRLAVHTLAAAAYNILRDLKKKRGRRELVDMLRRGLFAFAEDIAKGRIEDVPEYLQRDGFGPPIRRLADDIRRGLVNKYEVSV